MTERTGGTRRLPSHLLMLVTDRTQCGDRSLPQVVAEAIEGGVNAVQLREKDLPAGELLALARQLRGVCGTRALLLINDRVDVALLAGADGVHLGEEGLPVAAVRQMLPPSMRVGRSVHSVKAARQAELDGADYVVFGTLFASPSHPEASPAGLDLLRGVIQRLSIPVVAIGGIGPENVGECWEAGAAGVAAVSAIQRPEDPATAARQLAPPPGERAPQSAPSEGSVDEAEAER